MLYRILLTVLSMLSVVSLTFAAQTTTHVTAPAGSGDTTYVFSYTADSHASCHVTGVFNDAGVELTETKDPKNKNEYSLDVSADGKTVKVIFGGAVQNGSTHTIETTRSGGGTPDVENESWSH
jgi:hypothetical protein